MPALFTLALGDVILVQVLMRGLPGLPIVGCLMFWCTIMGIHDAEPQDPTCPWDQRFARARQMPHR